MKFLDTPIFHFPISISTLYRRILDDACFVKFTSVEEIIIEMIKINSLSFDQLYKNS